MKMKKEEIFSNSASEVSEDSVKPGSSDGWR